MMLTCFHNPFTYCVDFLAVGMPILVMYAMMIKRVTMK